MPESKVVQALRAFKDNYCWDKSLVTGEQALPSPALDRAHSNTALEDFINGKARDISG